MQKLSRQSGWIKNFIMLSLRKITIVTIALSIGLFQSIEFKLDVQATDSLVNPFASQDQYRDSVASLSKEKDSTLNKKTTLSLEKLKKDNIALEKEYQTAKGNRFNVTFNDNVDLVKVYEILSDYKYKIIGKSELRQFSVKLDDYEGFISKYESFIKNVVTDSKFESSAVPNDYYFYDQWALSAMNLSSAWEFEKGSYDILVAVIDSGIDRDNPDLYNADIRLGWDVIFDEAVDWDSTGHGTLVSGIIGASTNNGNGISAVNWNVAIVPYRVTYSDGEAYSSDIASAIYVATDLGIDVINISLGGPTNDPVLSNAITYAVSKGVIIVAAAGNDGTATYMYPASNTGVIGVGSINELNSVSYFSQHNDKIDVVAPGEDIISTADYISCGYCYYEMVSGTSFSSPYVAGVAALAKAYFPGLTPAKFESILKYSSRDFGATGYDIYYGYGVVDAERVLRYLAPPTTPSDFAINNISDKQITINWSKSSEYDVIAYQLEYKASTATTWTIISSTLTPSTTSYTLSNLSNGTNYDFRIKAKDHNTSWSPYSVVQTAKPIDNLAPLSPSNFKVTSVTGTQINLSWAASTAPDLSGYKISYKKTTDSVWTEVNLGKVLTYQISGLITGESYSLQIQAFDSSNNLSLVPASLNVTPITSTENLHFTDVRYNGLSFEWNPVFGATRYDIYQGTSATTITTKIGSVTETSFSTLSNLTFNTTYYFKVQPVANDETLGATPLVINTKTVLKDLTGLNVTSPNATTADLSWASVEGAAGYEVYYAKAGTTTYTFLKSVTTLTTNHTGLVANTTYNYKVRAYRMAGTIKVFGNYSSISSITTPPVAPVIKAVSKNIETITVSWTKVLGATQYVLYMNGLEHSTISDANAISVDVSGLNLGESYSFSLVAKNGELRSANSATVSSIPVPAVVGNFKISDTNFNRFTLSWDAVDGADHYDVYQGTTSTAVTTKIGSVTETSFTTLTALNFNTSYYYKVVPVTSNSISGVTSLVITGKTTLKEPSSLLVTSPNATTADLSWASVEGAAGYEVYYAKAGTTTYTFLKSVTTLTANHTGLVANTTYNYKVRAYRMAGTIKIFGNYSSISSITTPPVAPVIKAVSKNIETITVSWTKVLGATEYVLYMNGLEHSTISDANAISVDVSGLNLGESYSFSLVAKNGELRSANSATVSSIPVPAVVGNFKISDTNFNRFTLSWDSVAGADHYDVYQGTTSTAVTTKIGSVTETSFTTLTALNFNTSYYYKVVPVTSNSISGVTSLVITGKTTLKEPSSLLVTSPNATTADLSWASVEGAAGYEVYYAKAGTTTYTFLKSVTTLTTNHTGLVANTTYNYKVRAYRMAGTVKVFGNYSSISSITTPPVAPVIKAVSKNIETITVSWTKVLGATQYVLYMNGLEHSTISDANAISVDVSGLNLGESYSFSLVAKNGELRSANSATVSSIPVPAVVGNFKISDTNFNRFTLSWDAVDGADHYDVYQGTTSTAVTTKIGSVTETSFTTLTALNFNTSYYYKVVPVTSNSISGVTSLVITGKTTLKEPSSLLVTSPNATTADLSWASVEGAAGYEVYYAKAGTTTYTFLKSVTTLTANHTGLVANTTYNYKVRAYRMAGTIKIFGNYSSISSITTPPVAPVIKAVSKNIETITVSWTKVLGATEYVLYMNGLEHSTISDANAISVDVSGLNLGESYSFSLVAKNGELRSANSATVSSIPVPAVVGNFKISDTNFNRFTLSWDSVAGADHYDVYQGTTSTAVTTKIGSVTETSFTTLTALNFNTSYYYKVVPVTSNSISGVTSLVITGKTTLKEPSSLLVTSPNATTADLSWASVEGAAGYEVYYAKAGTTTYTFLKSVTTLTTNHTGLVANTTYNYKVRAYRMAGTVKVFGNYSSISSITTPPVAPVIKAVSKNIETITVSWTKVLGATQYVLYMNGLEHSTISDANAISVDVSGLNLGESYSFSLVAKNGELRSANSTTVNAILMLQSVKNLKVSGIDYNLLSLSWDTVDGADHYDVYQGTTSTTVTTKIGSVTETSFSTLSNLNFNSTYYFKIVPVALNGTIGIESSTISGKTSLHSPSVITTSTTNPTSVTLSWDEVEGASGYEVYYSTGYSTNYVLLKTVTTSTTNLTGIIKRTDYNYKVRAYRMSGTTKIYSAFSNLKTYMYIPIDGFIFENTGYYTVEVGKYITVNYSYMPLNATITTITCTSFSPELATIDNEGTIFGIAAGYVTMEVKTIDGYKERIYVSIVNKIY